LARQQYIPICLQSTVEATEKQFSITDVLLNLIQNYHDSSKCISCQV